MGTGTGYRKERSIAGTCPLEGGGALIEGLDRQSTGAGSES